VVYNSVEHDNLVHMFLVVHDGLHVDAHDYQRRDRLATFWQRGNHLCAATRNLKFTPRDLTLGVK
jgi:hypothetical protein